MTSLNTKPLGRTGTTQPPCMGLHCAASPAPPPLPPLRPLGLGVLMLRGYGASGRSRVAAADTANGTSCAKSNATEPAALRSSNEGNTTWPHQRERRASGWEPIKGVKGFRDGSNGHLKSTPGSHLRVERHVQPLHAEPRALRALVVVPHLARAGVLLDVSAPQKRAEWRCLCAPAQPRCGCVLAFPLCLFCPPHLLLD
jgi:hypothetical protein